MIRLFSTGLRRNGCRVTVLVQYGNEYNRYNNSTSKHSIIDGVVYRYCSFIDKPNSKLKKIIDKLNGVFKPSGYILKKAIRNEIDYVIMYNNYFSELIIPFIVCKIFRIKMIHFQVDLFDDDWYKNKIKNKLLSWIKRSNNNLRAKNINKYFDGALTINSQIQDNLIRQFKDHNKVYLFPHLVKIPNKNLTYSPRNKNKIIIGTLGPLNQSNGIKEIIDTAKILINHNLNFELLLIGGPQEDVQKYLSYAVEQEVDKFILFTGHQTSFDIHDLLIKCDLFVFARPKTKYTDSGFPTKLGEYLSCCKPLIVTDFGDISKYLANGVHAVIIKDNDPASIAENILRLINNPQKSTVIANNGFLWTLKNQEYIENTKNIMSYIRSI
jgi:glycosyltransferase involved in cell wall biosynthesis